MPYRGFDMGMRGQFRAARNRHLGGDQFAREGLGIRGKFPMLVTEKKSPLIPEDVDSLGA